MVIAYIGLGSNLGRRENYLRKSLAQLGQLRGIDILKISSLYQSEALGGPPQGRFLNAVVKVNVSLLPLELLQKMKAIEKKLGRTRNRKWGPRTIDLDLLTYGHKILKKQKLVVPHPRYHLRRFVLEPFCQLSPHFRHPTLRKETRTLLDQLTSTGQIVTIFKRWKK